MSAPLRLPGDGRARGRNRALVIVVSIAVLVLGLGYAVFSKLQSMAIESPEYAAAMEVALRAPQVTSALGGGVDRSGWLSANTRTMMGTGVVTTEMVVPVAGERGEGTIAFTATREGETVRVTRMALLVERDGRVSETVLVEPVRE